MPGGATAKRLSEFSGSRDNNFNLIRFIAAFLVLYSHSYPLSLGAGATESLANVLGMTAGTFAVDVFFITSGFLVTASLLNRNNLRAFIWARVLRIYPALIVAVAFCVLVVGVYFTSEPVLAFLSDPVTLKFVKRNTTLFSGVKYYLPGVFETLPYAKAINGSLWTLPYEVKAYTGLTLLGATLFWFKRYFSRDYISVGVLVFAMTLLLIHLANHYGHFMDAQKTRLYSMFFIGAAYYVWRARIKLSGVVALAMLGLLFISKGSNDVFFWAYTLCIAYLLFYVAYIPAGLIRNYNKLGDYSYGLYIYAFPVQQSVAALMPGVQVWEMVGWSFLISLVLAVISWHQVEKPFLKFKV
jgi:peptidoglycan/LPS O-acetylase OafA/YrhL